MDGRRRGRELIYLSRHCHHQNDSCIKMGSDESHFNVSLIVRDKVTNSVHKPQPFWRKRRAEAESSWGPSAYQPNTLPLGQMGSRGSNPLTQTLYIYMYIYIWKNWVGSGLLFFKSSFPDCCYPFRSQNNLCAFASLFHIAVPWYRDPQAHACTVTHYIK